MTVATQITIFRIFLIPVFIGFAVYYAESVQHGAPNESLRWATVATFALAAISDAVDGFVARRFNQRSRLGAVLDPAADKLLLLSAIFTLTFTTWPQRFPLWFPLLVVFRDVAATGGALVIQHLIGRCEIKPHWTGKAMTFTQIACVLWIMLDLRTPPLMLPVVVAAFFTACSGFLYLHQGYEQVRHATHPEDEEPPAG